MDLAKSAHLLGKYSTACPQPFIKEDPNRYNMKYKGRGEVARNFPLMTLEWCLLVRAIWPPRWHFFRTFLVVMAVRDGWGENILDLYYIRPGMLLVILQWTGQAHHWDLACSEWHICARIDKSQTRGSFSSMSFILGFHSPVFWCFPVSDECYNCLVLTDSFPTLHAAPPSYCLARQSITTLG